MKAAVYTQYGPPEVLQVKQVEKPTPGKNEVLVRIKATAVNSGDWRLRKADPFAVRFIFGLFKPKKNILGSVFSGEIERIGEDVKHFKVGDFVFGHTDMSFGAYAEYKCLSEDASIALKPSNMTHLEAAVIPFGGVTAWHFIKKAAIKPGQKVLVVGASGAVGSAAVQLAKSLGAHVTGVSSTANMALVKSIGADAVIDYTKEDFTQNGETYDVIFDTVKSISVARSLKSLTKNGIMILSAAGMAEMLQGAWISRTSSKKVITGVI
ncbi:MAG: NAD(P)-dependent alcohol dehydrogenase, partial [Saprospiraceae bacterium]|nr:NAD(P)-dependent alcohol dehydrogenase [Saprospiraceae bacterium]